MIDFIYERTLNKTRVETKDISILGTDLKINFIDLISGKIVYSAVLGSHMWAEWIGGDNTMTNIRIYNDFDEILYNHKWDVMIYGDPIEKLLWLYLKNRKSQGFISKGMVIGSHDGRNGHWIYPIQEGLSNALLIEGSEM